MRPAEDTRQQLRWTTVDEDPALPGLALGDRVTYPEFRDIEFLHVAAKSLINHVPAASGMPFEWTINVYRGCTHACSYCLAGDTRILMADGRTKSLADLQVRDEIIGTVQAGTYRRYVTTRVLDHWSTAKPAYRVTLDDGTELVASGDHRFLTDRGWKHVTATESGRRRRPHLTTNDHVLGPGASTSPPPGVTADYRRGYLCGMIRGDGHLGTYDYPRGGRKSGTVHRFRLALADGEPLARSRAYLGEFGISTDQFPFSPGTARHRPVTAIRTSARSDVEAVKALIRWPGSPSAGWWRGFAAGIFDAEGSYSGGVLRVSNTDAELLDRIITAFELERFDPVLESGPRRASTVRSRGGLSEHLRFFQWADPSITRKRMIEGRAVKGVGRRRVTGIEPLGVDLPLYDITTGTGDFIANGVISHNCFARPTHEYLDLDAGRDFERVIVVKVNAVERLRAELARPSWGGHHIAMGTNTDPYQRCEGRYRLTRGVVETLTEAGNPFSVLTKGTLALRDRDLFAVAAQRCGASVSFSIPTLDEDVWRSSEPGTPHPHKRMDAVAALNGAGVPSGVMLAPILPGISDDPDMIEQVVRAAIEAGATHLTPISLHLRPGVRDLYLGWLGREHPELVATYRRMYRSSYLPKQQRSELHVLVRTLVRRYAPPSHPLRRPRPARGATGPADPAPVRPGAEQLGLAL